MAIAFRRMPKGETAFLDVAEEEIGGAGAAAKVSFSTYLYVQCLNPLLIAVLAVLLGHGLSPLVLACCHGLSPLVLALERRRRYTPPHAARTHRGPAERARILLRRH